MKKGIIILGVTISLILISIGVYGLIMSGDLPLLNNKSKNDYNVNENITLGINDLQNALERLKNADNLCVNIKTISSIESENFDVSLKANLLTNEDEIIWLIENEVALHTYTILEEGNLVSYSLIPMFGMNEWIKSDEDSSSSYDNSYLDILLANINLFKIENNMFKAILPKDLATTIYNSDSDDVTAEIFSDIPVEIQLSSDKNISIISFDYSNNIKLNNEVITDYKLINSYTNIGNTKIEVPEDVKNSAKTS